MNKNTIGIIGGLYLTAALSAIEDNSFMFSNPRKPKPKPLPIRKQIVESLEERKEKLHNDIALHNKEGQANKHWKMFNVQGFELLAYHEKNAIKALNGYLRKHQLQIKEDS